MGVGSVSERRQSRVTLRIRCSSVCSRLSDCGEKRQFRGWFTERSFRPAAHFGEEKTWQAVLLSAHGCIRGVASGSRGTRGERQIQFTRGTAVSLPPGGTELPRLLRELMAEESFGQPTPGSSVGSDKEGETEEKEDED